MAAKSTTKKLTTVKSKALATSNDKKEKQELKSQKSVSFNPKVKVRFPKNPKLSSEKEMQARWYSDEEFVEMKKETKETLLYIKQQLENGNTGAWSDEYCSRGLEWKTLHGLKMLLQRKGKVTKALLNEQQRQRDSGMDEIDPLLIAQACSKCTKKSAQDARKRGIQDRLVTKAIFAKKSLLAKRLKNGKKDDESRTARSDLRSSKNGSLRVVRVTEESLSPICPSAA